MIRNLLVLGLASFLFVSCGSKDKKTGEDGQMGKASGAQASDVTDKDMTFHPEGSDSGEIAGLSTVYFEYDRSRLTTSARQALADNAQWLKSHKGVNLQLEGHTDSRGSVEYNLSLGERRAKAVKDYLVSLGIDSKSLHTISYGKEKLLDRGDSEEAHGRNRRVNFVPLPR